MKTIVFDLDGTLADTSGDLLAAANTCFQALGYRDVLTKRDALTAFQGGRALLRLGFSRLQDIHGAWSEQEVDAQYPLFLEAYKQSINQHTFLYPGVEDALQKVTSSGYKAAICTNKPEFLAQELTKQLGIRHFFGSLIGADTLKNSKPHPAPYRAAVDRAGGEVQHSFLVGDTQTDLETARAVGVPIVLTAFGPEGGRVSRFRPDALLDHYDNLLPLAHRLLKSS